MESKVIKFAEDYALCWKPSVQKAVRKAYLDGYNQCIEDEVDMDDFQKRLSDSYSDLKEKYFKLKTELEFLRKKFGGFGSIYTITDSELYNILKEKFEGEEIHY